MDDRQAGGQAQEPIAVPRSFFDQWLPEIRDLAELKVLLAVYRLLAEPAWRDGPLAEAALYADERLRAGLHLVGATRPPVDDIHRGIELAVARGALLRLRVVDPAGEGEPWLLPATPENRVRLSLMQQGLAPLPPSWAAAGGSPRIEPERPSVFRLYEQNVGLVTPIIADQLIEALELYPEAWIEEAIRQAVSYNRRQWRYIQRILERWATEGRGDETDRRAGHSSGSFDPDRHLRGKYAPIFRGRREMPDL